MMVGADFAAVDVPVRPKDHFFPEAPCACDPNRAKLFSRTASHALKTRLGRLNLTKLQGDNGQGE